MRIPTDRGILVLHEKHAPNRRAFDLVCTHCRIVYDIAEQLCARPGPGLGVDIDRVRAGGLLHDIGVYRLYGDVGRRGGRAGISHRRQAGMPVP